MKDNDTIKHDNKTYNIKNNNSVAKVSKQNYAGIAKRLFFLHSYIEVNIISL